MNDIGEPSDDEPGRGRDHSRIVLAVASVAVLAMVSSAVIGLVRHFETPDKPVTIAAIDTTMRALRVRMTEGLTLGSGATRETITTTGVYDFSRNQARATRTIPPAAPGTGRATGPTHFVFVGGKEYSNIDEATAATIPERLRETKHWIAESATGTDPLATGSPLSALSDLRRRASSLIDIGPAHIDGQAVRHYRAVITPRSTTASTASSFATAIKAAIRYDLYVDGHQRLVRLVITAPTIKSYEGQVDRFDFSDYGVPVAVVAPPPDQVLAYDDVHIELAPPRLTGPWTRAASGSTAGYQWKLFRAPADHDRICWSFEPSPPLANSVRPGATFVTPGTQNPRPISHDGIESACSRTGVWASPLQLVFIGTRLSPTLQQIVFGVVDDEVASVTRDPASGPAQPIALDPRFDGFVTDSTFDGFTVKLRDGTTATCPFNTVASGDTVPTCPKLGN